MSLDKLPINGFDLVFMVVLITGIYHGRKQGMSGELFAVLGWLAVLFGCALAYEPVGQMFAQSTGLFSTLASYLIAYIGGAIVILLLVAALKRGMGGRITGSDAFGGAEYYLGMGGGLIRFFCMLLVGLALLNARYYNPMEVRAMEKYQNDVYGSNFFPTLQSVQAAVFEKSFTGPLIKNYLGFLLIKPTASQEVKIQRPDARY
jgi:hypothetical protein